MSAKIRTVTLGCKVNQYETELVRQGLTRIGFTDAQKQEAADVCVVNTCTVTAEGDSKSRQMIRRLARKNPDARIVVMGCYATRAPEEVAELPGVSEVVTDKRELPDLLTRFGVVDVPTGLDGFSGRQRAYVKVQDGCLLRCSYCIIPMVRPELTSRNPQHIVDEVQRLVAAGHREVVLTGIHLGHYGVDWNRSKPREDWVRLAHLVRQLAELPGEFRIRLSSIEATEVTRELIGVLREFPQRIVPHMHVCLQSGSDSVLRRMRRRWGTKMFLDRCEMLREALDNPALTTDVIVGFPGESDEEFEQTMETCRQARFSKVHVFPYSQRRGTPAAEYEDQVDKGVQAERVARLIELETQLREDYFQTLIGRRVQLLVETARGFFATGTEIGTGIGSSSNAAPSSEYVMRGTSCRYAPVEVFAAEPSPPGTLLDVQVTAADAERLSGTVETQ
ncbi:tRNA (N(6)-L-threonylcarbamoyladenosine(37)-C(2))-methylthiotransferase MtaB [Roseimaritima ulvae]|uniref:Threonylcarbamoyladenosine tRNA methylthiotransferase MtaB n=1 Tax=Roseimaritima ulvae TaxID=980254 RepID=A0A5B9QXE7_9BACT|nr:tRNA (N(6)-L-threonylcarbamoyladenosine(37)-C(2))-methylthiotransferase MtaB [Roseimaritima ulvae]QEG43697.1 Threonylcarbamoyladenosine tRNA methylthiotransferase MtaB [Roseimaritima ulvae]